MTKKSAPSKQKSKPQIKTWQGDKKAPRLPKTEPRCVICGLTYRKCESLHCNGIPCDHNIYYGVCWKCRPHMTLTTYQMEVRMLRQGGSKIELPRKMKVRVKRKRP